jgi:hypothetical protein
MVLVARIDALKMGDCVSGSASARFSGSFFCLASTVAARFFDRLLVFPLGSGEMGKTGLIDGRSVAWADSSAGIASSAAGASESSVASAEE